MKREEEEEEEDQIKLGEEEVCLIFLVCSIGKCYDFFKWQPLSFIFHINSS